MSNQQQQKSKYKSLSKNTATYLGTISVDMGITILKINI